MQSARPVAPRQVVRGACDPPTRPEGPHRTSVSDRSCHCRRAPASPRVLQPSKILQARYGPGRRDLASAPHDGPAARLTGSRPLASLISPRRPPCRPSPLPLCASGTTPSAPPPRRTSTTCTTTTPRTTASRRPWSSLRPPPSPPRPLPWPRWAGGLPAWPCGTRRQAPPDCPSCPAPSCLPQHAAPRLLAAWRNPSMHR